MCLSLALAWALFLGEGKPPSGKALDKLVGEYLLADESRRGEIRKKADAEFAPLAPGPSLNGLRSEILRAASRALPPWKYSPGTHYLLDEKKKRGKFIVEGRPSKTLFIGLHGGGAGSGEAENAASSMGGGSWWWIYPEVLEKTDRGWTDSGTEEFVMDLIEAAKRSGKVDPNRVYVAGHSMGGYGAWTLGAHHADVFAGAAAYAGAPTPYLKAPGDPTVIGIVEGVIPNFYNLPLFVFQSLDDPQVPPEPNIFANQELLRWKKEHPGGFEFRYVEVNGMGHGAPKEGYLPSLQWLASHERVPRPKKFLWQPVLDWKRHFYWLYWREPARNAILMAEAKEGNRIEIATLEGTKELRGLSILLGPPLADLSKEVTVRVNGEERFRGLVPRTFSTLLLTLPRNDPDLLFDARVQL